MADEIRTEETMGAPAEGTGTAAAAAAPAQADPFADLAAPAAPSLSFGEPEPAAAAVQAAPAPAAAAVPQAEPEEAVLSPEEIKMVDAFVKQIDITNTQAVMTYGGAPRDAAAGQPDNTSAYRRTF
ncbi:MAG: hypothetical protein IKM05_02125 [Clostridia bacterium]|nr:hypothetical protein [Clostridia bacterium]